MEVKQEIQNLSRKLMKKADYDTLFSSDNHEVYVHLLAKVRAKIDFESRLNALMNKVSLVVAIFSLLISISLFFSFYIATYILIIYATVIFIVSVCWTFYRLRPGHRKKLHDLFLLEQYLIHQVEKQPL